MSDLKLRPERPCREGRIFSLAQARSIYPQLCRGAVYRYDFHEDVIRPGEPSKIGRPVIIMDANPIERVAQNKSLHVVPLSMQDKGNDDAIHIRLNRKDERAIWAQATTINSRKLRSFLGTLWPSDLKKLSDKLDKTIAITNEELYAPLRPGRILLIAWHDEKNMRPVMIVGSGHLNSAYSDDHHRPPVQVSAIKLNSANTDTELDQSYESTLAISPGRLLNGIPNGFASLEILHKAQMLTRQKLWLNCFALNINIHHTWHVVAAAFPIAHVG